MKTFLTNLLIVLALCLCGLIWIQWKREASLRHEIQSLKNTIFQGREQIQGLEMVLKRTDDEVKRLDGLKGELTATVKSNRQEIAELAKDLQRANTEVERNLKQIEAYKDALDRANESIKKQNEDIKKQNEDIKKLAEERNDIVAKHNKVVAEFNDLAAKWNTVQEQLANTNAPPQTGAPPKK